MRFRVLIGLHPEDVKAITTATGAVAAFVRDCVDANGSRALAEEGPGHTAQE